MLHLLEVIEKILPLNPDDWDQVKYQFVKTYATNNHSVTAITSRFQSLYRTKEPTGSPNIPEEVRVAKQICNMIIEKSDSTTGSYHPDEEFEHDNTDEYFDGDVVDDNDANNIDTGLLHEDDEEEEVSINANVGHSGSAFVLPTGPGHPLHLLPLRLLLLVAQLHRVGLFQEEGVLPPPPQLC
jgi:hypothetical protein